MPWAYRTVWKERPNGNPYQTKERYWVQPARRPTSNRRNVAPKNEVRDLQAERQARLAQTRKATPTPQQMHNARVAAARAAAGKRLANERKAAANRQMWASLRDLASGLRTTIVPPKVNSGVTYGPPTVAVGAGLLPGRKRVKTSPSVDQLDERDQLTLERQIRVQQQAAAVRTAAAQAQVIRKREKALADATAPDKKWNKESGRAIEALIADARKRQLDSGGKDVDPDWNDKLIAAYGRYVKHVHDAVETRNAKLDKWFHKDKHGVLVPNSFADQQAAQAYMKSSEYNRWVAEAKRLWGDSLTQDTGFFKTAYDNYADIGKTQRQYLSDAAKEAFLKTGSTGQRPAESGDDVRTRMQQWEDVEKWGYIASPDEIDPQKTSWKFSYDAGRGGKVTATRRTVEEEFEFREAQYNAEMTRRYNEARQLRAQQEAAYRNEAKLAKGAWYESGPERQAHRYIAQSIKVLGLEDDVTKVGQDVKLRDRVVDDAAATWESTHIRYYQHMVKTASGRIEAKFKSVYDQLAFEHARDAFRRDLFSAMGSEAPSWLETGISQIPGAMPAGAVLGGLSGAVGTGLRLGSAALGQGSRWVLPVGWKDLPEDVRKAAEAAEKNGHLSTQERQAYVDEWTKTPAGAEWKRKRDAGVTAETGAQNAKFLKDFYGPGDIWTKMDALAEFGTNITSDAGLNLISSLAFDPTVALPFNFFTWPARFAKAAELTAGANKLTRVPKFLAEFQRLEEPLLRASKLGKEWAAKAAAGGWDSKRLVDEILTDLAKAGDNEGADAIRKKMRELGLEKRQVSGEMVLTQTQIALREEWAKIGVDFEDMVQKADSVAAAEARKAALKAQQEAKSPLLAADDARVAARQAAKEAELKAARAATVARRERVKARLQRRVESPAPSFLKTEAPEPLRTEVVRPVVEDVGHVEVPAARPLSREAEASYMVGPDRGWVGPESGPTASGISPEDWLAHVKSIDADWAAHVEQFPSIKKASGLKRQAIYERFAMRKWGEAQVARPGSALDTVVEQTVSAEATNSLRDLIVEQNPFGGHAHARREGRVVAPRSEQAQANQMAAIHGTDSLVSVEGAQFSPGPYYEGLRETPLYKEVVATLQETPLRSAGGSAPEASAARVAQIERKKWAQRWLFEHARQSVAINLRKEGRIVPEGGGLDPLGNIPWVRNAEGEAFTALGGTPSHRQPIATRQEVAVALSGAKDEAEELMVLLEHEGLEVMLKELLGARARLGLVDKRGRPLKQALSYEEYAEVLERIERRVVRRRNVNLTVDLRAGEGSLVELNELEFLRATELKDFIRVGEQMVEDLMTYDQLGHYYERFSVLPGMNDGPGYATDLMGNILNASWRRSLSRPHFSNMLRRTIFSSAVAGPVAFRVNGAHLNALFQHIMLDDHVAFQHIRDAADEYAMGKITLTQYNAAIAEGIAMSNGGVQRLKDFGQTVRAYLTTDPKNPYLHMWLVMESRAGVHWAEQFMDSEGGFLAALNGVDGSRLHPNLALAMIPYSPLGRPLPVTHGFRGHLRSLATSTNPLFQPSLASWDDDVVIANLQMLYHGRDGAEAGVTQASRIIHYLMSRYGNTITRKHLTVIRQDLSIQRAFDVRDASKASQKGWAEFRKAYVLMKLGAQQAAGVVEGTESISRTAFAREFDELFTADKPFEKALRREFTPEVRDLFERMYWDGRITHDNAGLHTMAFFERMGHPKYQRGDDYLRYVDSYYQHMLKAKAEPLAHSVLEDVLKSEIEQTAGEAFEALTHMGESASLQPKVSYGRLRRFLHSNGFLRPMEQHIAEGKQREHITDTFSEQETLRLAETNENLLDLHDAEVLTSEGRRTAYDGATSENLVAQARDLSGRMRVTASEAKELETGSTVFTEAMRDVVIAERNLRDVRAAHFKRLLALSPFDRVVAKRTSPEIKAAQAALEEATDRAQVMAVFVREADRAADELAQASEELKTMRGKATKGEVRRFTAYVKELKAYAGQAAVNAREARQVVVDAVPRPMKEILDDEMDKVRFIGGQEEPSKAQPLFGSQGVLTYMASLPDDLRPWVRLRFREDYLKSQVTILMNNFNRRIEGMESLPAHLADEMQEIVTAISKVPGGQLMIEEWAVKHAKDIEKSHMKDYTLHVEHFGYSEEVEHAAKLVGRVDEHGNQVERFAEGYFALSEVQRQLESRLSKINGLLERGYDRHITEQGGEVRVELSAERRASLEAEADRLVKDVTEGRERLAAAPVVDERELANLRKLYPKTPEADLVKLAARQPGAFSDYPAQIAELERKIDFIERGLRGEKLVYGGAPFPRWFTKEMKTGAREQIRELQAALNNARAQRKTELAFGRAKPGRGEMHNARASQAPEAPRERTGTAMPASNPEGIGGPPGPPPVIEPRPGAGAPSGARVVNPSVGERLKSGLPGRDQPFFLKDAAKASGSNKFIGAGEVGSSTDTYSKVLGGSDTKFIASDEVFVSANGARKGRVPVVDEHGVLTPGFKALDDAIEAGAAIRTDIPADRARQYNVGEREVAEYLHEHGYKEVSPGLWREQAPDRRPPAAPTPASSTGRVVNLHDVPSGWKDDPNYVYVGRAGHGFSGEWGNPFPLRRGASASERAEVIGKYREWIVKQPDIEKRLESLRGKTLVCFCTPLACHGDVLAELANKLVEPALAEAHDFAVTAGNVASRTVPAAEVPIVRSVDELTELVGNEPELFMRWTPDLRADMQPGKTSRQMDPFQGREVREAGVSALSVPYARGTAAEAIISPVGAAKYDLGPAYGEFGYRRGGRQGTAGFKRRTAWMVRGKIVGYGTDGEPLLDPTSIVPVAAVSRKTVDEYVELHRAGTVGGKGTVVTGGVPPAVAGVTRKQQFQHAIDEIMRGAEAVDPDTGHPVDTSNRNAALSSLWDRMNDLGSAAHARVIPRSTDFVPAKAGYNLFDGPFSHPDFHQGGGPSAFFQMDYGPLYRGPMSKIHVAATFSNGQDVLRIVDAIAREMKVTYKWVKSATELLPPQGPGLAPSDFGKGGSQQGKFITAYPDPSIAAEFTRRLDEALQNARITGGDVAPTERRYAPDSPITHRYVPDSTARGEAYAADGDYATNPDYIGYRKGTPEDVAGDPVAAGEEAAKRAAEQAAAAGSGPAVPPAGPEIPPAPDPLDLASERVSASRRALEILNGMSEEDYISRELTKAWRARRLAKDPAARSAASTRIYELEKSLRVVRWEKAGRRGNLGGSVSRRTKASRVRNVVGKRAQSSYAARSIAPFIFEAGGASTEQGRAYYRIWRTSEVSADITSRVRKTGPVSQTYKTHGARIEAEMGKPVVEPSLARYGYRANLLSDMTYTEFLGGLYQFERSMRDPAFSAWLTEFKLDMDKRLAALGRESGYTTERWMSDRLQVRDTDHFDPRLFEEVEPEVVAYIHAERPGEIRTTKTDLKKAPGDIPPDVKILSEIVEQDVRAVVGRNKALAARGIDPHAYGEAWKVLRKPLQSKRYALDILRQAKEKAAKALYAAGHAVEDDDWDAVFRAEQNRQFLLLRQGMADKEAIKLLEKLTNGMVGATPRQIIEEFERRYGMDLEIKEFQPPQVTMFQKRTLEEAAKFHLQVTDLDDKGQLIVGLAAHGQAPPFTNRAAMRQWLVDYGFWSPRTADAIDSGKASWSVQQEDEFFRLSWGHAPEWADVTLLEPGGKIRDAVLFNEVERAALYRSWGTFTRNMKARFATGDMTRGERARFLVEGGVDLDTKPKRDLWMERRYVKERFRELAVNEKDQLIAFPELMTPEELTMFISSRTADNVPERVFQSVAEFNVFRQVNAIHLQRYLKKFPYAGKTASWSDFFQYTSAVAHDTLLDPIWLSRPRDALGNFIRLQAAIRRAAAFTQIGFMTLNYVDTLIKGPWAEHLLRSFADYPMSERAAGLTVQKLGWDPGGQLLHELGEVGTHKITAAFTRERKLYNVAGTVMEENNLDRALSGALGVAIGASELPAQGARAAENFTKLRLAKQHYDGVFAKFIKDGFPPDEADALTLKFLHDEIGRLWPTAGDGPIEQLFNQLSPFASYQFKNRLVFIGDLATHPVLFNYFDHIGDAIESYNRDVWERDHPGEELPDYLARLIELPWAKGTFIDLGQLSDMQRGFKTVTDLMEGKQTVQSLASQFVRLAGPNDINFVAGWANALHWGQHQMWVETLDANGEPTGQWHQVSSPWEAPWGGEANWLNSFWPVELGTQLKATIEGKWNATELTKLMYQTLFFGGLKSYDKGAGLNGFYWNLKDVDPAAADKWLDETVQGSDLRTWWTDKVPHKQTGYTPQEVKDILHPKKGDNNAWLHNQSDEYQDLIHRDLEEMSHLRRKWDNVIADMIPGSKEFSNALMSKQNERWAFISRHPELYDFYAGSMSADDWSRQLDDWQVDDLTQTFYNLERPVRKDGESEKAWQKRLEQFRRQREEYLRMFPQVAQRIAATKSATDAVWQAVEDHWFNDILTKVGTTQIAIDAAKQAKNFSLADQLYLMKDLQSEGLNEETAVQYFNPETDYKDLSKFANSWQLSPQLREGPFGQRLMPKAMVLPDLRTYLYNRADPAKRAKMDRDRKYAGLISEVIAKAKKSGNFPKAFVELIKADPWLMHEYFARNPGKREKWGSNDAYFGYMKKYHSFIAKGDFAGADRYFDSLPLSVQDRYLDKHPKQRAFRNDQRQNLKYMNYMKRWSDFYRKRDYSGGAHFFEKMPQWVKDRYYSKHPTGFGRSGGTGSSPYSRAMGKWVKLLQDNKDAEAKAWFDSMPQAYRDRYYSTHPEAKIRNDIKRVGQLGEYFAANDGNRVQYLEDNPEFAKWLKSQGNTEQTRRMLIMAGYQGIPQSETWLRRVYREKYPEIFSKEAAGARAQAKVLATLAEHPEMTPAFKRWLELVLATYAEELKHAKAPPKPLEVIHQRQHGMVNRARPHGGKSAAWVRLHSLS